MKRTARKKKKNIRLLKRMQRKLLVSFGIICVLFVFLIGRLMYIEYSQGDRYEKIVLAQQGYDSKIIPYQRGNITDSKGTVMATSVDVYNVILDCKVLNAYEDEDGVISSTIDAVTESFPEIERSVMEEKLEKNASSQYVVLAKQVSYEEMKSFSERAEEQNNDDIAANNIKGIWFEKEYKRVYPYNSLACSVLGFTTSGNVGVNGLENEYDDVLNGVNGRSYGYQNTDNDLEKTVIEATNGNTLVTTLDANIQSIVEQEILNFNMKYANESGAGSKNTAVVVMDPNSGEILAMAQYPTYDLNNPRDLSAYYTPEQLELMSEDEQLDVLNKLWRNFAVTYTYEPGSTAKPFTVACGLETGTLRGDETYVCDGGEEIAGYKIRCVNRNGHGVETIQDALSDSCNDALMQMSYAIGAKNFANFQSNFGFGQKTWIDLPGEASTANLIYDEEALESTINLATNSFGQNFNVTMVQMASAFSSLINGGELYQPHLVKRIVDDRGNTVEEIDPVVRKQTISREVSDQMKIYLRNVVANGTGATAGVDGYDIGGKTGTAQKFEEGTNKRAKGKYLVSFIGYAPQEHPEVLIYVVVDEPNVADQAHSSYAQEISHNIMQQILPYLNIDRIS